MLTLAVNTVVLRVSIAVKTHHAHDNSSKGLDLNEEAHLQSKDLVHCHHDKKQGIMQSDVVLEKELKSFYILIL